MDKPAVFSSIYPPSVHTFRGRLMLRLASGGADADELAEEFALLAADCDTNFPDDAPVEPSDVDAIVDEVVAEYQRVVTTMSPDAQALLEALETFLHAGIYYSYGEGTDEAEALEGLANVLEMIAEEDGYLRGFLYSTVPDLDDMVFEGRLRVAFGMFEADDVEEVEEFARECVETLRSCGLAASWSGDLLDRIIIDPILINAPLEDADEHDHAH